MKKGLSSLLRSNQSVFSFKDLTMLWSQSGNASARARAHYYVKKGDLCALRRGLYAKDKNYNKFELATKIITPAYVSFETVLIQAGIVFQHYGQIFVASYKTANIACDGQIYSFKKIKNDVLINQAGVTHQNGFAMASVERAFLDTVYLNKNYHFDNLAPLDWNAIWVLLPCYANKSMAKRVKHYYESILKE